MIASQKTGRARPVIEIARLTGGQHFRAESDATLREVYRRIDALEKSPLEVRDTITDQARTNTKVTIAAGIDHRGTYACRHTFAAWSIAAGVQLFYLSRIMGTSVTQIDKTYGHLVPDSEDYLRGLLDAYDAQGERIVAQI